MCQCDRLSNKKKNERLVPGLHYTHLQESSTVKFKLYRIITLAMKLVGVLPDFRHRNCDPTLNAVRVEAASRAAWVVTSLWLSQ